MNGTDLPNVGDLFVVSEETASPDDALAIFTGTSRALLPYLLFNIENGCMLGDLNVERMRGCGELNSKINQRH